MTTGDVRYAARKYRFASTAQRIAILEQVFSCAGVQGVEALAHALGEDPTGFLTWMKRYFQARARWRRKYGRRPFFPPEPPPGPPRPSHADAARVAALAAGKAGESRFARSGPGRQKKGRRLERFDPAGGGLVVSLGPSSELWPTRDPLELEG